MKKDVKAFWLVEIIVWMFLVWTFFLWIYNFFSIQNKNFDIILKEKKSVDLIYEAVEYFNGIWYDNIKEWVYAIYYRSLDQTWKVGYWDYIINMADEANNVYQEWKFVNDLWLKTNEYAWNNVFKRLIKIVEEDSPFYEQKYKKVKILVWDSYCDFEWPNCIEKEFIILQQDIDEDI